MRRLFYRYSTTMGVAACLLTLLLMLPSLNGTQAKAQATKRLAEVTKSDKAQEPRLALVIGNGNYAGNLLKNPVNDARAMAALLKKQGFVVMEKENLTQAEMQDAIRDFGRQLDATPGAVALFYFSGHGLQAGGQNWLVPIAHGIREERDVPDKAVSAQRVLDQMAGGRLNILILDACRDNPFIAEKKSLGKGLAKMDAPGGTLIAYATAPGKTADDNPDEANGLYTQELLKQMQTPGLKIEDVFKKTRVQVKARSKGQQLPWEESSLENDFFFIPSGNKPDPHEDHDNHDNGNLPSHRINPKDNAEMILIPAGQFQMGDADCFDNPRHTVTLSGYYIYKNLVTVKQFRKYDAANGSKYDWEGRKPDWGWKDDHPMVRVTWEEAEAYCKWVGGHLPTEAQWEKAARGTMGLKYPWGDLFVLSKVWAYKGNGGDPAGTTAVGTYGISPYGCTDMAGNVLQWCADWYDEKFWSGRAVEGVTDPQNQSVGEKTRRVLRGGSWFEIQPFFLRAAFRGRGEPANKSNVVGFRVALGL